MLKKSLIAALAVAFAVTLITPPTAHAAQVAVTVGVGVGPVVPRPGYGYVVACPRPYVAVPGPYVTYGPGYVHARPFYPYHHYEVRYWHPRDFDHGRYYRDHDHGPWRR